MFKGFIGTNAKSPENLRRSPISIYRRHGFQRKVVIPARFLEVKTILVRKRREVIPSDPKVMTDIDLSLPVFLYKDGESVVKGEEVLSDGRRIILFTTKEHLKILARAHHILLELFGSHPGSGVRLLSSRQKSVRTSLFQ